MKKPSEFYTALELYSTIEVLGEGGSGRVFLVEDSVGTQLALKCLLPDRVTTERLRRFKNELRFSLRNKHPNIIQVLDYGHLEVDAYRVPFCVMPLYPSTLRQVMIAGIDNLALEKYFSQMLDGVEAAHMVSIWHRDLKPENILIAPEEGSLVIADFGIAHFSRDALYTAVETQSSDRLANFQYAAPEQRVRGISVDHRADIYSLGLIFNEVFTESIPIGTSFKKIGEVTEEFAYLDEVIEKMIRQSPGERHQSIDEIKKEIISRKKEFVSLQRLSELKAQVIPISELDDPLVIDPISLKGIDYRDGRLILNLSQTPNRKWIHEFHNMRNYSSLMGKEPHVYRFQADTASILTDEHHVQKLVNYFKGYLVKANQSYKARILKENKERQEREKRKLQQEREEEERRLRILKNTEF